MDDDLVRDGRVARLELRGHRSGLLRPVNVGFVERPDGTFVVAARGFETAWARNLEADRRAVVTIGPRSFAATAELLDDVDPRRPLAIRDLILRYGTPSEGLGRGPVFVLTPSTPQIPGEDRDPTG
jgi:deazaflavin-dependent oxidoreductase (nitroreductase family)